MSCPSIWVRVRSMAWGATASPVLAVVAAAGLSLPAPAQSPPRLVRGAIGPRLAAFVERSAAFGFRGAVLASRRGAVVAALGVGDADLDGKVPNDANTLFELASVTKQFTAAAILVLAQQGKLRLEDPIAMHLPGVPDSCKAITIRHLLQHTSGMPGSNGRGSGLDLAVVVPKFLAGGPRHAPGSHWEYWNQGYSLLSGIVERTAAMPFVDFCEQRLFAPAGMRTACFTGDAPPPGAVVAIGRSPRFASRSALEHPYGSYGYQYRGMGGAVASVWDLWHWDRALCKDAVLGAAMRRELFKPGLSDYALGWFVRQHDHRTVQSHGGSVRGFVCDVRRYPDDSSFLCVLCNQTDAPFGELANALETLLFGGECELPPAPMAVAVGADLVGRWRGAGVALTVETQGGLLRARLAWGELPGSRGFLVGADLDHLGLYDWGTVAPLRVERDGAGKVVGVRLGSQRLQRQ